LDGGACDVGLESTIVGEEDGEIIIYRLGGLTIEAIKAIVGNVTVSLNQSSNPKAPGQLKSHYAPKKPIYIGNLKELERQYAHKKIGVLGFGKLNISHPNVIVKNLSPSGNYQEAAIHLFSYLRELDECDVDVIICDLLPEESLGMAINDRLQRAAN
jgi:L-threonylcarbamoyladenylate synthase